MITVIVQIKQAQPLTLAAAKEIFAGTAPKYAGIDGLLCKYYLLSEDGKTAGGVYVWQSRQAAEKLYTDEWKTFVLRKYGTQPSVTYFHTPVIVDNQRGEILQDE